MPMLRQHELSNLELCIGNNAARDARIGRAIQATVENIFTPNKKVSFKVDKGHRKGYTTGQDHPYLYHASSLH